MPGRDLDHPDRLAASSSRSTADQRVLGELRRVVPAAALVGDVPGDRGDGQDVG